MTLCLRLLVSALLINFDNLDVGLTDKMTRNIITKTCPCNIHRLLSFLALKIENFQLKMFDIFLIFAQNIDCGYTLEPPR